MIFSKSSFEKIKSAKTYNRKYSEYLYRMYYDESNMHGSSYDDEHIRESYKNSSERILSCMNLWNFDYYQKNKLLDLKKVNRCMNNRFCPNCRKVDLSRFLCNFEKLKPIIDSQFIPMILTLTIPNCDDIDLDSSIFLLNRNFSKLCKFFNNEKKYNMFDFCGGFKCLEITYNVNDSTYHPHLHCLLLLDKRQVNSNCELLKKDILGTYNCKKCSFSMYSFFQIFITKIWTLLYYNIRLSSSNLDFYDFEPKNLKIDDDRYWLQVDLDFLDNKGIFEIFKYCTKDSDIPSYFVFRTLFNALSGKRIRQGFGVFYNVKVEDLSETDVEKLILEIKEDPVDIVCSPESIVSVFSDCKIQSRKNSDKYIDEIT